VDPSERQLPGDAGLLPIRKVDRRIGLRKAFAAALNDARWPGLTDHTFLQVVRSGADSMLTGYEDQNDPYPLRTDPALKRNVDRSRDDNDLTG
jgi:hypothetical protein